MQPRVNKKKIRKIMEQAGIPGVSIAVVSGDGTITPTVMGITNDIESKEITPESIFGAASLSKAVFAYLVLKLISANKIGEAKDEVGEFKLPAGIMEFNLDTPLYKIFPDILKKFHPKDKEKAEALTARMVLSHTIGLPIVHHSNDKLIEFQFNPGTRYGYSGPGIVLLQEAIESLTGSNLQTLAQQYIFREEALNMPSSSFNYNKSIPQQAANSLYTTASDYAKFISGWMNDPELQDAFKPRGISTNHSNLAFTMKQAFLPNNWPIKNLNISADDQEHVSWGLGLGLQLDDHGRVIGAYHSGDMNEWRAWVAMNLDRKTAVVYFSNSHNGHVLAEEMIAPVINLNYVFNFFFQTYGFARNVSELAVKKGVEFNNGLRRDCLDQGVDINDFEMARSDFGQASNTAKNLTRRQSTTAKLMTGSLRPKPTSYIPKKEAAISAPAVNDSQKKDIASTILKSETPANVILHKPTIRKP